MNSNGAPKRRPWFRFRFGLRTLLIVTALVAVWLGLEARRAQQQQALVARIGELRGRFDRAPRDCVPQIMHRLLSEDQGCFVKSISVTALIAPTNFVVRRTSVPMYVRGEKIYAPEDMEELLRMPAMAEVRDLQLSGTAMTDDLVDELAALDDLESVTFSQTAVSDSAIEELKRLRPDCTVVYSARSNGPEQSAARHRMALYITDDLALFPRALHGDRKSIDALLRTVDWDTARILRAPVVTERLLKMARRVRPDQAELDDRELLDLVVKDANRGDKEADLLLRFSSAPRSSFSNDSLVVFLGQIGRDVMREPLQDALDHGSQELRSLTVEVSARLGDVDLLDAALSDPAEHIRVKAIVGLSGVHEEQAIMSIHKACRDEHPSVREAALRELAARTGNRFLDTFLEAMADPDPNVRWQAVHALERYPDARFVPVLIEALNDENSLIRCSAARTLGQIAEPSTEPALAEATEDEDSFVRGAAEKALAAMTK